QWIIVIDRVRVYRWNLYPGSLRADFRDFCLVNASGKSLASPLLLKDARIRENERVSKIANYIFYLEIISHGFFVEPLWFRNRGIRNQKVILLRDFGDIRLNRPDHQVFHRRWIAIVIVIALEKNFSLLTYAIYCERSVGYMHFWNEMLKAKAKTPDLCNAT